LKLGIKLLGNSNPGELEKLSEEIFILVFGLNTKSVHFKQVMMLRKLFFLLVHVIFKEQCLFHLFKMLQCFTAVLKPRESYKWLLQKAICRSDGILEQLLQAPRRL
jgi:hypothetical protein